MWSATSAIARSRCLWPCVLISAFLGLLQEDPQQPCPNSCNCGLCLAHGSCWDRIAAMNRFRTARVGRNECAEPSSSTNVHQDRDQHELTVNRRARGPTNDLT